MPPLDYSDASFDLIPWEPTALPAGQQSVGGNFADRDRVLHRHTMIPESMEEVRMGIPRGKAEPRNPAADTPSERGLAAKKQVFSHSLRRVNARLNRLLAEEKHARHGARLPAADRVVGSA